MIQQRGHENHKKFYAMPASDYYWKELTFKIAQLLLVVKSRIIVQENMLVMLAMNSHGI